MSLFLILIPAAPALGQGISVPSTYAEWHRRLQEAEATDPPAMRVYNELFTRIGKENDPLPFGRDNQTAHEEFLREYVRWGYQTTRDRGMNPGLFEKIIAPNTTWAARQYIENYLASWHKFVSDPKLTFESIFDFYQVAFWERVKEDRRRQLYAQLLEELKAVRCDQDRPPRGSYAVIWDELARDYAKLDGTDAQLYLQMAGKCRLDVR